MELLCFLYHEMSFLLYSAEKYVEIMLSFTIETQFGHRILINGFMLWFDLD